MATARKMTPKGRGVKPKSAASRRKVGRRDPAVGVEMVAELPPLGTGGSNARSMRYRDAMAKVRAKGKGKGWARIATFDAPNGAAAVRRFILAGERPIDGRLSEWEIETRRTRDSAGQLNGSELYVKLK